MRQEHSSSGIAGATTTTSSSSSSTTTSQLPRKRSFTGSNLNSPTFTSKPSSTTTSTNGVGPARDQNHSLTVNLNSSSTSTSTTTTLLEAEEPMLYDDGARDAAMELASPYDDMEVRTAYGVVLNHTHSRGALGTPHGHHALHGGMNYGNGGMGSGNAGNGSPVDGSRGGVLGMGSSMNILGEPLAANNLVTKLYHRSILHFKHNNFSSFVRQLNMYEFHKVNRTPRAQRSLRMHKHWNFRITIFYQKERTFKTRGCLAV